MTYSDKLVVAVKSNGKFIKEDRSTTDPTIWLPFGSEYSLFFKNLNSRKAVVKVSIDGKDVLNGHSLIVEPGKPFDLERFIADMKKGNRFKFIEKTSQISDHRGDFPEDGLIHVSWQYEAILPVTPNYWWTQTVYHSHPTYQVGGSVNNIGGMLNSRLSDNAVYGSSVREAEVKTSGGVFGSASVNCCLSSSNHSGEVVNCAAAAVDGITAKGSVSNQGFAQGSVGVLESEIHTVVLQLKGGVAPKPKEDPIYLNIIRAKSTCDNCGTTYRGWPQFCSNCGSAINAEV